MDLLVIWLKCSYQILIVILMEKEQWKNISNKLIWYSKASNKYQSKWYVFLIKVSFFGQCSKMQLIPFKNSNIKTWFIQFLWFFRLKCRFKGQIISCIHLSLPNAYKLMCFDRNINGNSFWSVINCLCNGAWKSL